MTIRISEDVNRLMDEPVTSALTQYGAQIRFKALAQHGSKKRGLALLDKLDRAFAKCPVRP
ncbi:MAG TPA: hypothetical protein VMR62_37615 [Bryobacteraceae bacterium]|jgi:hypothetical protein|nr:hypothetical protein [Bryobacteraceae bacterium]